MTKPKDYRSQLDVVRNSPHYFKMVKDMMERHELKAKSINFRMKLLQDRRKSMYQNEYDRIKGIIAHTVVPQQTRDTIKKRMEQIEKFELA